MVRHIWSLVCKETKIDATTNNLSIIDVLENLQFDSKTDQEVDTSKPIGVPINFEVVSLYHRDKKGTDESVEETIVVLDPKGAKLGEFTAQGNFNESQDRTRVIVKFNMIALTTSGTYLFQITRKGGAKSSLAERVVSIPLDIAVRVNDKQL